MSGIKGERRIVAVTLMSAVTTVRNGFTAAFHRRGIPQSGKIPIVVPQVPDGIQDFAPGKRAFIVNDGACSSRKTLQLGTTFKSSLGDQLVHVDIEGCFEKARVAGVSILDER